MIKITIFKIYVMNSNEMHVLITTKEIIINIYYELISLSFIVCISKSRSPLASLISAVTNGASRKKRIHLDLYTLQPSLVSMWPLSVEKSRKLLQS